MGLVDWESTPSRFYSRLQVDRRLGDRLVNAKRGRECSDDVNRCYNFGSRRVSPITTTVIMAAVVHCKGCKS